MGSEETLLTIGEVSELTGVNSVTLRAWQRRYGLLKPQRTPKGHRLYTTDDVSRIRSILVWLDKGVPVSQVKALLENQPEQQRVSDTSNEEFEGIKDALMSLNAKGLTNKLLDLTKHYPIQVLSKRIFEPLDDWLSTHKSQAMKPYVSLWQTTLRNLLVHLSFEAAKGKAQKRCWLIGLDEKYGYRIYTKALQLQLNGYSVTTLEDVNTGITGLYASLVDQGIDKLVMFSDQALPTALRKDIEDVVAKGGLVVELAGKCVVIHPELSSGVVENEKQTDKGVTQ
ncbi:MerR family transcriptional regulator [Enterovibrio coralii]|uniref:HTH merR-type domain-containing protein n=1 Tax=Enterovibrio coralii TaxID=294935 RepID=A0A135ICR2_9GAMM|nr:MerR family transcriptional regulator [Enterovibrio coralii]KXF83250.1 hypothetical protein ATN88_06070 [Enterovibrio coralii]